MNRKLAILIATGALLMVTQQQAKAISIRLTQGVTVKTVADQSVDDSSSLVDVVHYSGAVGTYFVNITTGQALGGGLDLNSVDTSTTAGGTLRVELSGYVTTADHWTSELGGTTAGSVTWNVWSSGVGLFDHGSLLGTYSSSSAAYSTTLASAIAAGPKYITLEMVITHSAGGVKVTSFDGTFHPIPDGGATAMLLGLGFLGLGAVSRRKA